MGTVHKLIDVGSSVAVVMVGLVLAYSIGTRYFYPSPTPLTDRTTIEKGLKLQISDLDFSKNERTLVLVLSTVCRFCTESVPFYQRLLDENRSRKEVRIVGLFPQDLENSHKYANEHDLVLDEILAVDLTKMPVRGTPTIMLVDSEGAVLESWYGKLKPDNEKAAQDIIFAGREVN